MTNFILIFLCVSAGVVMSSWLKILPKDAHKSVNAWLIYIALPALALRFVPEVEWSSGILLPAVCPLVIWFGAWVFVQCYDRKKRLSSNSHTALLITCGLGNTAFLGFPMISAYYGESEIHHAIVIDQITFILFSTLGVIAILRTSSEKAHELNFSYIFKKVFRFPPFIGCLVALILPRFVDISVANPLLDKLVATMSPMALFSIGIQLKLGEIKHEWRLLSAGLLYKLILAPILVLLLALALHSTGNLAKISVFEAGMSSHITSSLLASQYNLNPRFCSLMVGLSIVAGFITSTVWYFILQFIF